MHSFDHTMRHAARALVAALLAAAVVGAGAAQARTDAGARAEAGGTLMLGAGGGFATLDPTISPHRAVLGPTQLQLVSYPEGGGSRANRLVPEAAVAMPHVSADGKTYTFTVRGGLRFSDGSPVTAANFAWALNRALRPELGAYAGLLLRDIVGAADVAAGTAMGASGISASGQTLTVRLTRRSGDFAARLAMGNLGALPLGLPLEEVTSAPVVSAGPYFIAEYVPGDHALLARNPYWNRAAIPGRSAHVDAIRYTFGLTGAQIVARVEAGELDYATPPRVLQPDLAARYGVNQGRLFVRNGPAVEFLGFNHDRPLFRDNARLRRAINFAVDRAAIVDQAGATAVEATDQTLIPGMPGFLDARLYPLDGPDLETARRLARGATRDGHAVIYAIDTPPWAGMAETAKENLAAIGIDATIRSFDLGTFLELTARRGEPWDIATGGWITDYLDPQNTIETLFHGRSIESGFNTVFFDDPAWNLVIDGAAALPGEAHYAAFGALDVALMRLEAPIAPLVSENVVGFTSARVGCVGFNPLGFLDYAAVCLR
jgi:peptide/nickel transport system substrate-binding protein